MKKFLFTLSALSLAPFALAQDAEEKSPWSGETELGYSYESGNTNEENLLFRQKVAFEQGKWLNTLLATAENKVTKVNVTQPDGSTKEEDQRTEEAYFVENK